MPRAKRPLSEVDPNASTSSRKSPKIGRVKSTQKAENDGTNGTKQNASRAATPKQSILPARTISRKWSTPSTVFHDTNTEQLEEERDPLKEDIEYRNKDNSKLRRFLSERCLSMSGTREELITRLENSSINYEDLSSAEITEMLKERHLTMCSLGNKENKIQRLRLNDQIERDTGNSKDCILYAMLSVAELMLKEKTAKQDQLNDESYTNLQPAKLCTLLQRRNLSISGSKSVLVKRLQKDDQKLITKEVNAAQARYDAAKLELESKTGRPVNATEALKKEDDIRAIDYKTQDRAQESRPRIPVCNYDWKDSHWAERTERQLNEICTRRGMPGCGPKAAMLKWLDTGNLEYEDMYIVGLSSICEKRGVKYKSGDKKVDLIRRLRDADGVAVGT